MLAPADNPLLSTVAAAASCGCCRWELGSSEARKLGSSEADVNFAKKLSSHFFKASYVIRVLLFAASYGLYP